MFLVGSLFLGSLPLYFITHSMSQYSDAPIFDQVIA